MRKFGYRRPLVRTQLGFEALNPELDIFCRFGRGPQLLLDFVQLVPEYLNQLIRFLAHPSSRIRSLRVGILHLQSLVHRRDVCPQGIDPRVRHRVRPPARHLLRACARGKVQKQGERLVLLTIRRFQLLPIP